ncbi:MAG: septum formation protein Maf [Firmicutes bacterium HGW-Firmicutes-21]|nr:MAG: septum formation protein Maf [Firmicutes bacterium HGW-Firmicutes-21]
MDKKSIILASKSPRRREILRNAGYIFTVEEAATDETVPEGATPPEAVKRIALDKALYVKQKIAITDALILAADTMVYLGGVLLGKPRDTADAFLMLKKLSGAWHEVYTGYAILCGERRHIGYEVTEVKFRNLSEREIIDYIKSGEPFDKAGSYGVQGRASAFVECIKGDFFNVMGLPICKISQILDSESYT